MGGISYEKTMENPDHLCCDSACRRYSFRASDAKRNADLRLVKQTEIGAAGLAVSCRLDNTVYPYGDRVVSCCHIKKAKRSGLDNLRDTTYIQLFLVDYLFQSESVPVCIYLACDNVAPDPQNYRQILSNIRNGRGSDDTVSALGSFCRLLKPVNLHFKLTA